MKFSCPNCTAKYQIADDKVAGRTVKMKCRKCGTVIPIVTPSMKALENAPEVHALSLKPSRPGPPTIPAPMPLAQWHAGIGGAAKGPLSEAELQHLIEKGEATRETYVWREGMDGWLPLSSVQELQGLLVKANEAPAPPSMPAKAKRPGAASVARRAPTPPLGTGTRGPLTAPRPLRSRAGAPSAPLPKPTLPKPSGPVVKPTAGAGPSALHALAHAPPVKDGTEWESESGEARRDDGAAKLAPPSAPAAAKPPPPSAPAAAKPAPPSAPAAAKPAPPSAPAAAKPPPPSAPAHAKPAPLSEPAAAESPLAGTSEVAQDGAPEGSSLAAGSASPTTTAELETSPREREAKESASEADLSAPDLSAPEPPAPVKMEGPYLAHRSSSYESLVMRLQKGRSKPYAIPLAVGGALIFGITLGFVIFGGQKPEVIREVVEVEVPAKNAPASREEPSVEREADDETQGKEETAAPKPPQKVAVASNQPAAPSGSDGPSATEISKGLKGLSGLEGLAGPTGGPASPTVSGGSTQPLDASQIQSTVTKYRTSVQRGCWQPALDTRDKNAPSSARVSVSITVAGSGQVTSATTSGDPNGYRGLANCISNRVKTWRFPPSNGTTTVNVPFVFAAQ